MRAGRTDAGAGFTLIEILVVIAIISILASLSLAGIIKGQDHARKSIALTFVATVGGQLEQYALDTGRYPRAESDGEENEFPALFEALCGERPPRGRGGPSGPYLQLRREEVLVIDEEEGPESYRPANGEEIYSAQAAKYVRDPWGNPYVYRENRSRPPRPFAMRPGKFDLYSLGRDGVDQTRSGEKGDDIGDW